MTTSIMVRSFIKDVNEAALSASSNSQIVSKIDLIFENFCLAAKKFSNESLLISQATDYKFDMLQKLNLIPLNKSDDADSKVGQIDSSMLGLLLSSIPEMRSIEDMLDERCYLLHEDFKLNLFTDLFKQIVCLNDPIFSSKSNEENANILFNVHFRIIIHQVKASDKFDTLIRQIFDRLEGLQKTPTVRESIRLEVENLLKERFLRLHSCFLRLAVSSALGLSFKEIILSNNGAAIPELNMPETSIYDV
ncbi:MAG: hypothetical protein H7A39_00030 [Chlamydiales bacterium]|nr:hypothetical protein [Chlamydiales bacterium]